MVYSWFKLAKEDLHTAIVMYELNDIMTFRAVTFNCQQCVEKSVKGLLTYNKIKFDKTHDIKELSEPLLQIYPDLKAVLIESDRLTTYAVEFRYPGAIDKPISSEEIKRCVLLAKEVFEKTCEKIPFDSSLF